MPFPITIDAICTISYNKKNDVNGTESSCRRSSSVWEWNDSDSASKTVTILFWFYIVLFSFFLFSFFLRVNVGLELRFKVMVSISCISAIKPCPSIWERQEIDVRKRYRLLHAIKKGKIIWSWYFIYHALLGLKLFKDQAFFKELYSVAFGKSCSTHK